MYETQAYAEMCRVFGNVCGVYWHTVCGGVDVIRFTGVCRVSGIGTWSIIKCVLGAP